MALEKLLFDLRNNLMQQNVLKQYFTHELSIKHTFPGIKQHMPCSIYSLNVFRKIERRDSMEAKTLTCLLRGWFCLSDWRRGSCTLISL